VKRGWLVVALLLSLGVNLGLVGVAVARRAVDARWERAARGAAEMPPPERLGRRLADRLGVAQGRREAFLAVQRRLAERTATERRELVRVRLALRRELLAPQPDRDRIATLLDELGERERALNRALVDSVLESRATLDGRELELYLRFLERAGPPPGGGPRRRFGPGAGIDRPRGEPPGEP